MAAIDQAMVSKIMNAISPVGTGGIPGTMITALGGTAMKVKLTSTASSAASSGTEIASGNGYTTNGQALGTASTPSSAGSNITLPAGTALSWTCGLGGGWSIYSFELLDSANLRTWFGNFNGAPVAVANGNTFQIAIAGITLSMS